MSKTVWIAGITAVVLTAAVCAGIIFAASLAGAVAPA